MTLPHLTHALLRRPAASVAEGITSQHLGAPDVGLTQWQFDGYEDALRACGLALTVLPADERFPDGHFVEDTAVIFREMAFITHPGAASREGEVASIVDGLRGLHHVYHQDTEARLEGGDVLFCMDRVLIGLSGRTNRAGAEELRAALWTVQDDLRVDFVPLTGVLHLKTGITELVPGILLRDPTMQTDYAFDSLEVIDLPPEEGYAANVLPINDAVIIPAGFPMVAALADEYAGNVVTVEMSEFRKMDGALTCLSLRY